MSAAVLQPLTPLPPPPPSPRVVSVTPSKAASSLPDDFWNVGSGVAEPIGPAEEHDSAATTGKAGEAMEVALDGEKEEGGANEVVAMEPLPGKPSSAEPMETADSAPPEPLSNELISRIVQCLEELRKCLEQAPLTIVSTSLPPSLALSMLCSLSLSLSLQIQPPIKSFPMTTTITERSPSSRELQQPAAVDHYPALFRMFQSRRLMESLLVLVSAPSTLLEQAVFAGVRDLLLHLLCQRAALLFLSSQPSTTNALVRALTQAVVRHVMVM